MPATATLTDSERHSADAIRATLDAVGRLKDADAFRAANCASREKHGDERHEAIKFVALHNL